MFLMSIRYSGCEPPGASTRPWVGTNRRTGSNGKDNHEESPGSFRLSNRAAVNGADVVDSNHSLRIGDSERAGRLCASGRARPGSISGADCTIPRLTRGTNTDGF